MDTKKNIFWFRLLHSQNKNVQMGWVWGHVKKMDNNPRISVHNSDTRNKEDKIFFLKMAFKASKDRWFTG